MHTTPLAKRIPRKPQKTLTYRTSSGYAVPKSVPVPRGSWSAQILSIEPNLWSKFNKNRGKKLYPQFEGKEVAKKHDTRNTFTAHSVRRTQTFKFRNVTFVDGIRATIEFSILFSKLQWHSNWLSHLSLAKKANSRLKTTVFLHWATLLRASTLNHIQFKKL